MLLGNVFSFQFSPIWFAGEYLNSRRILLKLSSAQHLLLFFVLFICSRHLKIPKVPTTSSLCALNWRYKLQLTELPRH